MRIGRFIYTHCRRFDAVGATVGSAPHEMPDLVDTPEQAAALELAPLLVREPLERFLDEHGIGDGRAGGASASATATRTSRS